MQTSNLPDPIETESVAEQPTEATASELDQRDNHWQQFSYALFTLMFFSVLSIWIMQNSVNAYFQQTYHQASPLAVLDDYPVWTSGATIGQALYQQHDQIKAAISAFNSTQVENFNSGYAYTPEYKIILAEKRRVEQQRQAVEAKARAQEALRNQFSLNKNQQVFFAGDSLMQGVAPFVQKSLLENYEVKSVNLSKQSTGLSYPGFFNWPQTIKDTIESNPQIKILVVFLGPNDPWDMPNPQGGGHYLKFQSPEWESLYRSRIAAIIQTAKQHQVSVMWLTPPNMRKESLNNQMIYLNQVIRDEVQKNQALFLDSRAILGTANNVYSDYLVKDGLSIKMRSADGIHFSSDGQKILAQSIAQHIQVAP